MISPELLRRYPFFSAFTLDDLVRLADAGSEQQASAGHVFFREGERLTLFYLVVEGAVAITMALPVQDVIHSISSQMTGQYRTEDVVLTTVGPGDVFGWSGLVAPHAALSGATAQTDCRIIAFACPPLLAAFENDCRFGYLMLNKMVQVTRARLQAERVESLALARSVHTAGPLSSEAHGAE